MVFFGHYRGNKKESRLVYDRSDKAEWSNVRRGTSELLGEGADSMRRGVREIYLELAWTQGSQASL
jgi:hypothetical protein